MHSTIRTGSIIVIALGLACTLAMIIAPPAARAEDLEITIAQSALERFFQAATPFKFQAELMAGQKADMVLSNPKLFLTPGQPGQVHVQLDYQGQVKFLGLPTMTGQVKPEVRFQYDPGKGALKVTLHGVNVKGLPLDSLLEPNWLPLTATEPIRMADYQMRVQTTAARTQVIASGLRLMLDYNFTREPLR